MRLSLRNVCDVLADRLITKGYRATSGVRGSTCWVKVMVSDRCVMYLNSVSARFGKVAIEGYVKCGMVRAVEILHFGGLVCREDEKELCRAVMGILADIDAPCTSEAGCWNVVRYLRVK